MRKPVRIGVGGPVGSGKTALIEKLCKRLRDDYQIAVVTNDIFTKEDALILTRVKRHWNRHSLKCWWNRVTNTLLFTAKML